MKITPGTKVDFLDYAGSGVVVRIEDDIYYVEDSDGFEIPCKASDIVVRSDTNFLDYADISDISDRIADDLQPRIEKSVRKASDDVDPNDIWEVDLHIHELMERNSHLTNHQMIGVQLAHFNRMIEMAREQRIGTIIFIHGVGKGVLKHELREALNFIPDCSYRDADARRYGHGATEVCINYR